MGLFDSKGGSMPLFRIIFVLLVFAIGVRAQKDDGQPRAIPAAISCSAHVPPDTCKWVTSVFALHQLSSSLREIDIDIDDKQAFQQEQDRLQAMFRNATRANPTRQEQDRPTLPSPYDDSLLFELGEEGYIARVAVSIELFSKIKFVPDSNGVQYATSTGELDRESVNSWAFYITGYVEGSRRSRVHSVIENSERISER
jgi:hypothetical protein